jgi:hypothetical protein
MPAATTLRLSLPFGLPPRPDAAVLSPLRALQSGRLAAALPLLTAKRGTAWRGGHTLGGKLLFDKVVRFIAFEREHLVLVGDLVLGSPRVHAGTFHMFCLGALLPAVVYGRISAICKRSRGLLPEAVIVHAGHATSTPGGSAKEVVLRQGIITRTTTSSEKNLAEAMGHVQRGHLLDPLRFSFQCQKLNLLFVPLFFWRQEAERRQECVVKTKSRHGKLKKKSFACLAFLSLFFFFPKETNMALGPVTGAQR